MTCRRAGFSPTNGAARIRQELRARGVSDDLAQTAVTELRGTEMQRARDLWLRRYGQPAGSPAERARQMRFLAARGFSGDVIRKVVGGSED
jgi:regulatory protein